MTKIGHYHVLANMAVRKPFDVSELDVILDQWTTGALERLDEWVDADRSVIDIRDLSLWLSGALAGQLGALNVPMPHINKACAAFQDALDEHLMKRLPTHPGSLWQHNVGLH